jgi:hypothetical protein
MKKLLGIVVLTLFCCTVALAGSAERKYWETYAERSIANSRICVEEAKANGDFNSEIFQTCRDAYHESEKIRLELIEARDDRECESMRRRIENSNASAGSNAGNFLLGMLERQMEDMACGY